LPEVLNKTVIDARIAGMGCCLIRRDVLKELTFSTDSRKVSTEDTIFFNRALDLGFTLKVDCSIPFCHIQHPFGEKKNAPFNPRSYILEEGAPLESTKYVPLVPEYPIG
jgi:hypothetical protein